ncbi:hypothetical protein [Fimbriiglobus ruber]|nr:hypothetical protein [Fimbriiglobus ruber]
MSSTGTAAQAKLDSAGAYKVDGQLIAGDYKVYLSPPEIQPSAPGTKPAAPVKFEIPPKFQDPNRSGVIVTVKTGPNDIPVEFK